MLADPPRKARTALAVIAAIAGGALLVWQIHNVGLDQIAELLARVRFGFLGILALSLARFTLRSFAWITLIGESVPLGRAVAATITGDAVGNMTPLSLLVSEPTKAFYLGRGVKPSRALAALAAETFLYSVTVAIFIILGTVAMLTTFPVPDAVQWAGLIALAAMVTALAAALWIVWRQPAVASTMLARIPLLKLDVVAAKVRDFESQTYGFVRGSRGVLSRVFTAETSFHLLSFAESYLTLWLVTGRSLPLEAFILDTVNRIINVLFRVVPFKVGVDEMSAGFVAPAIGLSPVVGVTLALIRKGRLLTWAAVGFGLLARRAGQR